MKNKGDGRWRERGITSTALAAAARDEAPGRPGAELTPWVAGETAGGARSPRGAAIRGGGQPHVFGGESLSKLEGESMPRDTPGAGGTPARGAHARARRAGVTYINLILGTPYGDPVELAKAIARHFGLKTLAVLIDDGDEPAVAYACSKKVRERVFSALESEGGLEEALARRFRGALVLSIFDGLDTVILVARER